MTYVIIILAVLLAAAIIAGVYFWKQSKNYWDLYKQEEKKRWDEISITLCLENALIGNQKSAEEWKQSAKQHYFNFESCRNGNKVLQDKLSAILCPTNNHVWQDGVCKKCGREYNG